MYSAATGRNQCSLSGTDFGIQETVLKTLSYFYNQLFFVRFQNPIRYSNASRLNAHLILVRGSTFRLENGVEVTLSLNTLDEISSRGDVPHM